ncbi:lupus La [Brachionus plicatilis]|uniref:Lupus La n=1 Tax=Brachionus plicatilis TaxID=10195 RepID=A0A3M7RUW1_BRAPC|nr:lupus La [Brachionus plicatilis]
MTSELSEKIVKQIEYYFGDINLSKDKFLQEETQKDSGWVPLETMVKFNRLKQLTTDYNVIIDALKNSTSDLLEIDEENLKIRRAKPLPENLSEFETNLKQNTVYVKGFAPEMTLDDLYSFFDQHGKVLQIFMKRFPATRQFKGSVFVTFETQEQMSKFMELEELKHNDQTLTKELQEDYLKRKAPKIEKIKENKAKKEQQKLEKFKQQQEAEEAYLKEQQISGAILHVKNLPEDATRESLKEVFDNFGKVKYSDYNKGQIEGYVRFSEENKAKEVLEKADEIKMKDRVLELRVLEGEEELNYWKEIIKRLSASKNRSFKGGRKQKNDRKGWNKNKRSLNDDKNENENEKTTLEGDNNKKLKTEDA